MNNNIGSNIKQIRKMQGISQKLLSRKINISVSHLSHIENNTATPSLDTLVTISQLLKVPLDCLVQGTYSPIDKTAFVVILNELDKIDPIIIKWITQSLSVLLHLLKYGRAP